MTPAQKQILDDFIGWVEDLVAERGIALNRRHDELRRMPPASGGPTYIEEQIERELQEFQKWQKPLTEVNKAFPE